MWYLRSVWKYLSAISSLKKICTFFTQNKLTHLVHEGLKLSSVEARLGPGAAGFKRWPLISNLTAQNLFKYSLTLSTGHSFWQGHFPSRPPPCTLCILENCSLYNSITATDTHITAPTSRQKQHHGEELCSLCYKCRWETDCRDESKCSEYDVLCWFIPAHHSVTDALSFPVCSVLEKTNVP